MQTDAHERSSRWLTVLGGVVLVCAAAALTQSCGESQPAQGPANSGSGPGTGQPTAQQPTQAPSNPPPPPPT